MDRPRVCIHCHNETVRSCEGCAYDVCLECAAVHLCDPGAIGRALLEGREPPRVNGPPQT